MIRNKKSLKIFSLKDTTVYGADIFYARYLRKQNFVLWASNSDTPDFGGKVGDTAVLFFKI